MAVEKSVAANYTRKGQAIGGWLVLVAVGLIVSPVGRVFSAIRNYRVISEGSPDLVGSLWFWSVYSIEALLVLFNLALLPLFFLRKSALPFAIQAYLATCIVGAVAHEILGSLLLEWESSINYLVEVVIASLIWILYFQISKRVRMTFVA